MTIMTELDENALHQMMLSLCNLQSPDHPVVSLYVFNGVLVVKKRLEAFCPWKNLVILLGCNISTKFGPFIWVLILSLEPEPLTSQTAPTKWDIQRQWSSHHQVIKTAAKKASPFCVAVSRSCNRQGHSIVWLHHGIYAIKVVRISVKFPCNNTTTNYSHHQNRTCKGTLTQSKLDRGISNSLGGFIDEFKATSLGSSHKIQHLTGMERWKATAVSCQTKWTDHLKNLGKMRAAKGRFNLSICPSSSYIIIYSSIPFTGPSRWPPNISRHQQISTPLRPRYRVQFLCICRRQVAKPRDGKIRKETTSSFAFAPGLTLQDLHNAGRSSEGKKSLPS